MRILKFAMGTVVAGLLVAGSSGGASAQSRYDWSGVYVGGNIGASANSVGWNYFGNPAQVVSRDFTAFSHGMQAGAQIQMGQVVLGAEFGLSGSRDSGTGPDSPVFAPNFDTSATVQSVMTIGPRLGWAFNNWMIYGTGGYARTNARTEFFVRATPSVNDVRTASSDGWFAGGGIEWAMTKNWIVGLEYRHIEADRVLMGPTTPVANVSRYVDTSSDEFKARLSFKLGH